MKKVLLGIILASAMLQSAYADFLPVANVKLDGECYEFSLVDTNKIVPAISSQCTGKILQVKILYSTRVKSHQRSDGALILGSTVYAVVYGDSNTYQQLRVSDKLPI